MWRLLEIGERTRVGDEILHMFTGKWEALSHDECDDKVGPGDWPFRRPVESCLQEICNALGWQGGTVHQVVDEIQKLRALKS